MENSVPSSRQGYSLYLVHILAAVSRGPGGFGSSFEAWLAWEPRCLLGSPLHSQDTLPLDIARVPLVWLMELLMGFYHETLITYSSFSNAVVRNIIGTSRSANTEIWSHTVSHRLIFNNPEARRAEQLISPVLKAPPTKLQHFKDDTRFYVDRYVPTLSMQLSISICQVKYNLKHILNNSFRQRSDKQMSVKR